MWVRILETMTNLTVRERRMAARRRTGKTAESTGRSRFPPTATDQAATRVQSTTALGAPPVEVPNTYGGYERSGVERVPFGSRVSVLV